MNCPTSNTAVDTEAACLRALYFLKFRPRSRFEIQRYLKGKQFSAGAINEAIHRLETAGYLNDPDFARLWVESRLRSKPRSASALRAELREKGISEEIILATVADMDEKQAAWTAVRAKLRRWGRLEKTDFKKKIYGCLIRRGFHHALCGEIFEQAWAKRAQGHEPDRQDIP